MHVYLIFLRYGIPLLSIEAIQDPQRMVETIDNSEVFIFSYAYISVTELLICNLGIILTGWKDGIVDKVLAVQA